MLTGALLFGALGDFNQMITEGGLDRPVDLADRFGEDDLVEFLDHHALAELAEVASLLARGTQGMFPGDFSEIGAPFDLLL